MKKILVVSVIMAAFFLNGCSNNPSKNDTPVQQQDQITQEKSVKTSLALMKELVLKDSPTTNVENYKIFEEVKSPYSKKSAILFGLDPNKTEDGCCSEPIGIFANNEGSLGTEYDILKGALIHLYLDNVKWQDDNTILYDFVIFDEGGKQATQKSLKVK